jgi:hypothetical protein
MAAVTTQRGEVTVSKETFTRLTTIDTLVDMGIFVCRTLRSKNLSFSAATNTLVAKVLGSIDGGVTYPITVEAEFDVTVASPVQKVNTVYYTHLKLQVKPKVAATHGTLTVYVDGASF